MFKNTRIGSPSFWVKTELPQVRHLGKIPKQIISEPLTSSSLKLGLVFNFRLFLALHLGCICLYKSPCFLLNASNLQCQAYPMQYLLQRVGQNVVNQILFTKYLIKDTPLIHRRGHILSLQRLKTNTAYKYFES